jgi:hypothetical protein
MEKMNFEIISSKTKNKYFYGFNDYAFHHGAHAKVKLIKSTVEEELLKDGFAKVSIKSEFLVKKQKSLAHNNIFYEGEFVSKVVVTQSSVQNISSEKSSFDNNVVTSEVTIIGQSELITKRGEKVNCAVIALLEEGTLESIKEGLYPEFIQRIAEKID